jgi:hypothetical protein
VSTYDPAVGGVSVYATRSIFGATTAGRVLAHGISGTAASETPSNGSAVDIVMALAGAWDNDGGSGAGGDTVPLASIELAVVRDCTLGKLPPNIPSQASLSANSGSGSGTVVRKGETEQDLVAARYGSFFALDSGSTLSVTAGQTSAVVTGVRMGETFCVRARARDVRGTLSLPGPITGAWVVVAIRFR